MFVIISGSLLHIRAYNMGIDRTDIIIDIIDFNGHFSVDMRDVEEEDPDLVTPQVIDDILERELSNARTYSLDTSNRSGNISGYFPSALENTSELIALGGSANSPNKGRNNIEKYFNKFRNNCTYLGTQRFKTK